MSLQKNVMEVILNSSRSVFNIQSLRMLTECRNSQKLTQSLYYYIKEGKIRNPRRGIYTKSTYDKQEMACSLFRPAYISLEYVLQRAGVVFQYDDAITCVSYLNRTVWIDDKSYQFRIINPELWIGLEGIEQHDNILIATPERAFLDLVYLSAGNCYFDNLHPLNKTKVRQLLPHYRSKVLAERTDKLLNLK
ncbi:MAG: type IV toxin-antitoxin system AbiEi family antitoxin domain-containing protein [Bacteroidaceae bacterium]|nr:type IV toxin-antitoxin system AbiEi family antitoxin domain-containing protein [Bacteroidaceae bacterium]